MTGIESKPNVYDVKGMGIALPRPPFYCQNRGLRRSENGNCITILNIRPVSGAI